MSPLTITENTSFADYRALLTTTFPNLEALIAAAGAGKQTIDGVEVTVPALAVTAPGELVNDLARIGSFFTKSNDVLTALVALETAIGEKLAQMNNPQLAGNIASFAGAVSAARTQNSRGETILFKTHKLLSSCLKALEDANGFNNVASTPSQPVDGGQFMHSNANFAASDTGVAATPPTGTTPTTFPLQSVSAATTKPALPKGVPVLTGIVGGQDFNRILLRYGYHWKDPGAGGVAHGEYTHRIQWYALVSRWAGLGMINRPVEVFKSLGALWSRNTYPRPVGEEQVYLWEMLFDCFPVNTKEPDFRPRTATYSCPDNLTAELCKVKPAEDPLFKLRVLMAVRRFKRAQQLDADGNPADPTTRFTGTQAKTATTVLRQNKAEGFLAWYNA